MSELARKKDQLSKLRKEVSKLERQSLIGLCYRKRTPDHTPSIRESYFYLQITGLNQSSSNVRCVIIEEKRHPNISIEYNGELSLNKIYSDYSAIDENVFTDKVQKLLHRVPLLKQAQNRKREESD